MKKNYKKLLLLLGIIISTFYQKAYAATFELTFDKAIIIGSICLIGIGLAIIIISKTSEKKDGLDEEKPNKDKIVGLVEKKENDNDEKKKNITVDTIFKELPTFSANKFHDDVFEDIKEELNKILSNDEIIEKITLIEKNIIDFEKNNNKYTITSKYKIKYSTTYNNEHTEEKEHHANTVTCSFTVISKNDTSEAKEITKCPTCFGKIKDPTRLRCVHYYM